MRRSLWFNPFLASFITRATIHAADIDKNPEKLTFDNDCTINVTNLILEIIFCNNCHNISDKEVCEICSNPNRNEQIICVVEDVRDVMAIENTSQFKGLYHVLGGKISPMEGVGPHNLTIDSLIEKIKQGTVKELILALSSTMEGDTTNFYLYKKIKPFNIQVSTLSRGVSIGTELQYADGITLGRSIINRLPFKIQ